MRIVEIRDGDLEVRVGLIIRCNNLVLVEHPTPSKKWPNPMFDLPKGHLQKGESLIEGAIRECWEETNIKFEPWKLKRPIQMTYCNNPLYLFLITLDEIISVGLMACVSTFVEEDGIRKPECDGYAWINPYYDLHLVQEGLRPGISYYFNKDL